MPRPDEGLIHTWLDGECTPEESARIEALVASDPAWAAAVAEARGLVAASSRIIGALDAVPGGVVPKQPSKPAPKPQHTGNRGFRVRPWMGIAAGLVLVAGTAVVLRETPQDAFVAPLALEETAPAEAADSDASPSQSPAGELAVAERTTTGQGAGVQALAEQARTAASDSASAASAASASAASASAASASAASASRERAERSEVRVPVAAPALQPGISLAKAPDRVEGLAANAVAGRSVAREAAAPAAPPQARAPAAFADAAKAVAPIVLTGCWRVSAPPEFLGLLRNPPIARVSGDTLVLQVNVERFVTVTRAGDKLSGELTASLESCPPTP